METERLNNLSRISDFSQGNIDNNSHVYFQISVPFAQNLSSVTGTLVKGEA